ncbi:hypothetical protein L3Q82_008429 [Scortum barcoo]|uniref:Uncharacterized protein n=1 Tax=Scortum barcoo TaxID=214431 RepID=A0ACB8XD83_9TELE|nr:hypothetical protein L3Q82_008429 [Scortum barcoo]
MPRVSFAPPSLCLTVLPLLDRLLPPSRPLPPTVRDADGVPPLVRERFILSGYRPAGLPWRCYALSLFQIHNETVNVWSHLLAAVCVALRFMAFAVLQGGGILGVRLQGPEGQGFSVDASSLPLVLYVFSAVTYLSCRLYVKMDLTAPPTVKQKHLDRPLVAGCIYDVLQCGGSPVAVALESRRITRCSSWITSASPSISTAALSLSTCTALTLPGHKACWDRCVKVCFLLPQRTPSDELMMSLPVGLPAGCRPPRLVLLRRCCCFAKLRFRRPYPLHRKLCQVLPMGVAYLLDISPLAHRLTTRSWTNTSALPLHVLQVEPHSLSTLTHIQVVLFLLSAFFFSCPIPECFSPGSFDIVGHGHQLFHILLSLCTLAQQEALFQDFLWRRPALIREFGEQRLLLACASFLLLTLCCTVTALTMRGRARAQLTKEQR